MGQSEARKVRRTPTDTLATYIPRLGATPLEFQPGSRWMYSPSDGIDVLARVVEIVSGTPMNVFLKQRIFDPLDMPETSHYPTDAQMPRFVTAYGMADEGLVETQNSLSMSSKVYFAGGGGLVSTVDDYSHFAQMLANGGAFNGKRLLSPRTVRLMTSVHVPSTLPGRVAGEGYGLSVRVIENADCRQSSDLERELRLERCLRDAFLGRPGRRDRGGHDDPDADSTDAARVRERRDAGHRAVVGVKPNGPAVGRI